MAEAKDLLVPLFVEAAWLHRVRGRRRLRARGRHGRPERHAVFDSTHGDEQAVKDLIDRAKQALNIESVYCESRLVGYRMYGGVLSGIA